MPSYCSECGTKYVEGAKFCRSCGTKKTELPETIEKKISPKPSIISYPEPQVTKALIEVSNLEAKELATSIVYSAGALLPFKLPNNQMSSPPSLEDLEAIKISVNFIERIFNTFPEIKSEQWLGYEEYNKIKKYLSEPPKPSQPEKKIQAPQANNTQTLPEITPPTIPEPVKPTPPESVSVTQPSSTEQIKSTIIDVHTDFPEIYYILYLTDSRIIGARKDKFDDAKEVGVAVGGILGAIVGAGVDATINRNKKSKQEMLSELTPDEILAYDDQNWEMKYSDIMEIELKKPGFLTSGEIILVEPNRKFVWILDVDKDEFMEVIEMFNEVIPEKVKVCARILVPPSLSGFILLITC